MHASPRSLAVGLALVVGFSTITTSSCSSNKQPTLTEEDMAGQVFVAGDKVKAPLGKRKKQSAKVLETYGKLAKLAYADSNIGWALVKEIEPPGAITRYPEGDTCAFKVGDAVRARWSTSRFYTNGTIDEVHGKVAHIQFSDGDVDWAVCDDIKPPAEESASSSSGGGGGQSDAVTKCKRKCNSQCDGAQNKSKCVGQCRRACDD